MRLTTIRPGSLLLRDCRAAVGHVMFVPNCETELRPRYTTRKNASRFPTTVNVLCLLDRHSQGPIEGINTGCTCLSAETPIQCRIHDTQQSQGPPFLVNTQRCGRAAGRSTSADTDSHSRHCPHNYAERSTRRPDHDNPGAGANSTNNIRYRHNPVSVTNISANRCCPSARGGIDDSRGHGEADVEHKVTEARPRYNPRATTAPTTAIVDSGFDIGDRASGKAVPELFCVRRRRDGTGPKKNDAFHFSPSEETSVTGTETGAC